jgi:2,5-diketo-D-gluconate reductase B
MSIYFQQCFQRGFGTFPLRGDACKQAVLTAAEVGYRAFDTAQMYQNQAETGAALKDTGLDREAICITTKVENKNYTEEKFLQSVELSLQSLQVDYVDVLLLHWPPADFDIRPPLELLQQAREKGYTRHIGVSNFTAQMMREANAFVSGPIATNQVEFHPLLNQDILLNAASDTGIPLAAYCSVARGEVFNYPEFETIGKNYGKSAAQIVQRWILQKGVSVNTMSTKRENIKANFDIMDFTLSSVDMATIDKLTATQYRIVDKSLVPWAPDFD